MPFEAERLAQAKDGAALRAQHGGQRVSSGGEVADASVLDAETTIVAHARDGEECAAAALERRVQVCFEVLCREERPTQLRVLVRGALVLLRVHVNEAARHAVLGNHLD